MKVGEEAVLLDLFLLAYVQLTLNSELLLTLRLVIYYWKLTIEMGVCPSTSLAMAVQSCDPLNPSVMYSGLQLT